MKASKIIMKIIGVTAISLLASCGGGGSDGSNDNSSAQTNRAPIVSQQISDVVVAAGESVTVDATGGGAAFSDADGDTLTYSVELSDSSVGLSVDGTNVTGQLSQGRVTVTVTADDGNGGTVTMTFDISVADQRVSGRITYDNVPATTNGLDFGSTEISPVRGVYVELLDASETILQRAKTNENGEYQFQAIDLDESVKIRVKAELIDANDDWDLRVVDNTQGNRLYAVDGSQGTISSLGNVRDLHFPSGWSGNAYTQTRAAAPFAILDTIYTLSEAAKDAWPGLDFEPLSVYWSELNVPESGDVTLGQVGTDSYNANIMYILGAADVDTTEFDDGVVAHEWVHFFQDTASRSDSIGGGHSGGQLLDFRVSFSEGYATALGVFLLGTNEYVDTYGSGQSSGFRITPDTQLTSNRGWFNEDSVMLAVYDTLDGGSSDDDGLEVDLARVLDVHSDITNDTEFVTIFNWAELLETQLTADESVELRRILGGNRIYGTDGYGAGESNDGGKTNSLPVYDQLSLGQTVIRCMDDQSGTYNKLDNVRFFRFDGVAGQRYQLTVERATGIGYPTVVNAGDPDYFVYVMDRLIEVGGSGEDDREVSSFDVDTTAEHRVALREYFISEDLTPRDDEYCYEITLVQE